MSDLIPDPLPEVEFTPHGPWVVLFGAFLGFWFLFAVNVFVIRMFTDTSEGTLAALAAIGQIILAFTVSAEQMLGVLVTRAGIKVRLKPSKK